MAGKQYYIENGNDKPVTIDEETFNARKGDFYKQFPDANVFEVSDYDNNGQYTPDTYFQVYDDKNGQAEAVDYDKFTSRKDEFFRQFPDARVQAVRPVRYNGVDYEQQRADRDALSGIEQEIAQAEEEYKGYRTQGEENDWGLYEGNMDYSSVALKAEAASKAKEGARVSRKRLDELYAQREKNPAYQAARKRQIQRLEDAKASAEAAYKQNESSADPDVAKAYSMHLGNQFSILKDRDDSQIGPFIIQDEKYNHKQDCLVAAEMYYDEAAKIAKAPSKFDETKTGIGNMARGAKDNWMTVVPMLAAAGDTFKDKNLLGIIRKVQEHEEKDCNMVDFVSQGKGGDYLAPEEQELLKSFVTLQMVQAERSGDLSIGYQAGQSAIASLGFMGDFLMTGNIGKAVTQGATKGIVKGIAKKAVGMGLQGVKRKVAEAPAKFIAGTMQGLVRTAVTAPLMPSFWSNASDSMLTINDAGSIDLSGKELARAMGDGLIEVFSENAGAGIEAAIAAPFRGAGYALGKTRFGSFSRAIHNAPALKLLRESGFNNVGELGEEWYGALLRTLTGVDGDAVAQQLDWDTQLTTIASFAPMMILGTGVSVAQYKASGIAVDKAADNLAKILRESGYDSTTKENILALGNAENPTELAALTAPVIDQVKKDNGPVSKVAAACAEYVKAVARYRTYDGIHVADVSDRRSEMRDSVTESLGGNDKWIHVRQTEAELNGEPVNMETVRVLTDSNGNRIYVTAEDEVDVVGLLPNGDTYRISKADLAKNIEQGTITDSGEIRLQDHIDMLLAEKKDGGQKMSDAQHAEESIRKMRESLTVGQTLDIGTPETPSTGTVMGISDDGVIIQKEDGTSTLYNWEEMGNMTGNPITQPSEEQVEDAQAQTIVDTNDVLDRLKLVYGKTFRIGKADGTEEECTVSEARLDEDGSIRVTVKGSGGVGDIVITPQQARDIVLAQTEEAAPAQNNGEETTGEAAQDTEQDRPQTPLDINGKPLPMRTNADGDRVVDEKELWKEDPRAWADYNDHNPNAVMNSKEFIEEKKKIVDKQVAELEKEYKKEYTSTMDGDKLDAIAKKIKPLKERSTTMQALIDGYNAPQQKAEPAAKIVEGIEPIQQKWNTAAKIDGMEDEIVLANGETVKGRYVLTEAEAVTPSHNPANGYEMSEGFPVDENGKTVNDRDYRNDADAKAQVEAKARDYDQRALQEPVVVSQDGVVLSGNDRTMAGQMAAANGTDTKYTGYLAGHAAKWGFSPEQVAQFKHPRVVFVPSEAMPYNAATFAKFNAEGRKSQSKTEKAVKAGKIIRPETLAKIAASISRFEDINEFYANEEAVRDLIDTLIEEGVVTSEQVASMMDGTRLSGTGMDIVEGALVGSVLEEDALRVALSDSMIRRCIVSSLAQIVENSGTGKYSLKKELSDAILMVYDARKNGGIKYGETIQDYVRQERMFGEDVIVEATVQLLGDTINNKKLSLLKKVLQSYNTDAVDALNGQADVFSGNIYTKEDILRKILKALGYEINTFDTSGRESEAGNNSERPDGREDREAGDAVQVGTGGNAEGETGAATGGAGAEVTDYAEVSRLWNAGGLRKKAKDILDEEKYSFVDGAIGEAYSYFNAYGSVPGEVKNNFDKAIAILRGAGFDTKNSVLDNTTDTAKTNSGERNDTATPQNTVSDNKDAKNSEDATTPEVNSSEESAAVEEKEQAVRDEIATWERELGVQVAVYESEEDVPEKDARTAIKEGKKVMGWYNTRTGKVSFYLPNILDSKDALGEIAKTFIHEVVSHKGLRGLLGNAAYDSLCDKVWESMQTIDKAKYLAYVAYLTKQGKTSEEINRAAADEYIAHIAESQSPKDANIWQQIVADVKAVLARLGLMNNITDEDLQALLVASYKNLNKKAKEKEKGEDKKTENKQAFPPENENKSVSLESEAGEQQQQGELTEQQIRESGYPDSDVIDAAVDFINGTDTGFSSSIAYETIKEYVWVNKSNGQRSGEAENSTQLAASSDGTSGVGNRHGGRETAPVAPRTDKGSGRNDNTEQASGQPSGMAGAGDVQDAASNSVQVRSGDNKSGRHNGDSEKGVERNDVGRISADSGRNGTEDTGRGIEAGSTDIAALGGELEDLLSQFGEHPSIIEIHPELRFAMRLYDTESQGVPEHSLSRKSPKIEPVVLSTEGLEPRQIMLISKIIFSAAKLGYANAKNTTLYEEKDFRRWFKSKFGETVRQALGYDEAHLDSFMREAWRTKLNIDGERLSLEDQAARLSKAEIDEESAKSLEDKAEAQKKVNKQRKDNHHCDRIEIRKDLPILEPGQWSDVVTAERQFYSEDHNDYDHAYGKGIIITNGTGTGKTYSGMGVIKRFLNEGKDNIIIVCPANMRDDWMKTALKFDVKLHELENIKDRGKGVCLTSYENYRQNREILANTYDLVVYDECQKILEGQQADPTLAYEAHRMLTNKDEDSAIDRLLTRTKEGQQLNAIEEEIKKLKAKLKKRSLSDTERWNTENKLEQLKGEQIHLESVLKTMRDSVAEDARKAMNTTKVLMLSATPFNAVPNLKLAEGIAFMYPQLFKADGTENKKEKARYAAFISEWFDDEDPDQASIDFGDHLLDELETMSYRELDNGKDYSRDFPDVSGNVMAARFNAAWDFLENSPLSDYAGFLKNYQWSTQLFETMKISAMRDRLQLHLDAGRKIIIFHNRMHQTDTESAGLPPVGPPFMTVLKAVKADSNAGPDVVKAADTFLAEFGDILRWEDGLDYRPVPEQVIDFYATDKDRKEYEKKMAVYENETIPAYRKKCEEIIKNNPRLTPEQIHELLPSVPKKPQLQAESVCLFNGECTEKEKIQAKKDFNSDESTKRIICVTVASGGAGLSLHDTTGKYQRVTVNTTLPVSPIGFIQSEGREFRFGNKTNGIFEYPRLGINLETYVFAMSFNKKAGIVENLAHGSRGRGLKESIMTQFYENSGNVPIAGQGVGGKAMDKRGGSLKGMKKAMHDFGIAKQKGVEQGDNSVEEPIGYKMAQFAGALKGDDILVPYAGRGSIVRYISGGMNTTVLVDNTSVEATLAVVAGDKINSMKNEKFAELHEINKADIVLLNGNGKIRGTLNVAESLEKAFSHLNEGGRLVAVLPDATETNAAISKLGDSAMVRTVVHYNSSVFGENGSKMRIVVIDKVTNPKYRNKAATEINLAGAVSQQDLCSALDLVAVPERIIDRDAIATKKLKAMKSEFTKNGLVENFEVTTAVNGKIYIRVTLKNRKKGMKMAKLTPRGINLGGGYYYSADNYISYTLDNMQDYNDRSLARAFIEISRLLQMDDEEMREAMNIKPECTEENFEDAKRLLKLWQKFIKAGTGLTEAQLIRVERGEKPEISAADISDMVTLDVLREKFEAANHDDEELQEIFDKVFARAKESGLTLKESDSSAGTAAEYSYDHTLSFDKKSWNRADDRRKAEVLLHEMIHGVTSYALDAYKYAMSVKPELEAATEWVEKIYKAIQTGKPEDVRLVSGSNAYALENTHEFLANITKPQLEDALRKRPMWVRTDANGRRDVKGMEMPGYDKINAWDLVKGALFEIVDNYDADLMQQFKAYTGGSFALHHELQESIDLAGYNAAVRLVDSNAVDEADADSDYSRFRILDDSSAETEGDKTALAQYKEGHTTKLYRNMQVIEQDGKRYAVPPMAGKIEGKWQEGVEIHEDGTLEPFIFKADEHPELVRGDGKFYLDKGNGKGLWVAYDPYNHAQRTMLNDQFSEAQDRPNLVIVEGDVPAMIFKSGYTAQRALLSEGEHEWKAGPITANLDGTRSLVLSRYFRGLRVVPTEEVAENIFSKLDGRVDVMPSNVVTPQVRKALEEKGINFVETDNNNTLLEGEHVGDKYTWWYGKNADKNRKKGYARRKKASEKNEGVMFRIADSEQVQGMGMTAGEVIDAAREYAEEALEGSGIEIKDMAVVGSRSNGTAKKESDLDILLEYAGDSKEYAVFNRINGDGFEINGVPVDINPIRKEESGDIDSWIEAHAGFNKNNDEVRFRTEEERQNLFDRAKAEFGTTEDLREAGYILPDGDMLDFSGKKDGGDPGRRSMDHRSIGIVITDKELDSATAKMCDFINEGVVRILPESATLCFSRPLTDSQKMVARRFIRRHNGEVIIDIIDESGYTQGYKEYDAWTEPDKIFGEITSHFAGFPLTQDDDNRFRIANDNQAIFVSNAMQAVEGLNMNKASGEQWLKAIQGRGGLKAGEDKWLGLSEWLGEQKGPVTKEALLTFIGENAIKIEEDTYSAAANPLWLQALKNQYRYALDEANANGEKDIAEYAMNQMKEEYGEDFELGFWGDEEELHEEEDSDYFRHMSETYGGSKPINSTRRSYTSEGLENKREIALTVPTIEPWNELDQIHFGDAGNGRAVAWIRFGDKSVVSAEAHEWSRNGRKKGERHPEHMHDKVLFIDEIQSKRHQEGREKGYSNKKEILGRVSQIDQRNREIMEIIGRINEDAWAKYKLAEDAHNYIDNNEERKALIEEIDGLRKERSDLMLYLRDAIPSAPFEKNWHELAFKRMLRLAAEEGYDEIVWTSGEIQADRYNLSRYFDAIVRQGDVFYLYSNKTETLKVDESGMVTWSSMPQCADRPLTEVVGKDMAAKMMALKEQEKLEGDNLRIGGEGMNGFYDKILVDFANKYCKKWGTKVEDKEFIGVQGTWHSVDVTPEMQQSVMEGQTMFRQVGLFDEKGRPFPSRRDMRSAILRTAGHFMSKEDAVRYYDRYNEEIAESAKELYDKVLSGQFDDVTLRLINEYIENANFKTPYGRRISQRVPQAMERSLYEGERKNAVDALFSRISERAVARSRRKSAEGRREAKERKKELLKGWAVATGNWHTSVSDFTDSAEPFSRGTDSDVYVSKDGNSVIKVSKGKDNTRFPSDIDAYNLFNFIFPNSAYRIVGYGEIDGKFVTFLEQPIIDLSNAVQLTKAERIDFMRDLGFKPYNDDATSFTNGAILVTDLQKSNVVRLQNGDVSVLDSDVKLHGKDTGGIYDYPDVEEDEKPGGERGHFREAEEYAAESKGQTYSTSTGGKMFAANDTARICGVPVSFVSRDGMPNGHEKSAGVWRNGKIYVCLENNPNAEEATKTVLHEAIGHMGLRRLVGNGNMTAFCMEVYRRLPEHRRAIIELAAQRHGWNIAEATEEYLAVKAETFDTDGGMTRTLWDVVREAMRNLLAKIGINVPLSERDLRWILWNSYMANKQSSILNEAKRQTLAHRLGFSLAAQKARTQAQDIIRDRQNAEDIAADAARIYNKEVAGWRARLHESWVDLNDSVNRLVSAIEKESGKAAQSFEDIRKYLNQQSSKGLAAVEKWEREFYKPLAEHVAFLTKEHHLSTKDIERYMMLKHGIERNMKFAKRDAREYYRQQYVANVRRIMADESKSEDEKQNLIEVARLLLEAKYTAIENGTDAKYLENRERDYAGLTGLYSTYDEYEPFNPSTETEEEYRSRMLHARHPQFETIGETEAAAQEEVAAMEGRIGEKDIDRLWELTNAATKSTIKHQYDSNMISKDRYEKVRDMFDYYIPLRGFEDKTAGDMYDYYNDSYENDFTPPILKAKGRTTVAESPFGYIGAQASSAIAQDMKNESKLALYYFLNNRPNSLAFVSDVWYEKETGEDGKTTVRPVYPPITEDLSSDRAKEAYARWEADMNEKAKAGLAFKGTKALGLDWVINATSAEKDAHVIKFKVGGEDKMIIINGNPRAAQAINNELNIETSADYSRLFGKVLRYMSSINTSLNPEFWLSNLQRDMLFSFMNEWTKGETAGFARNYAKAIKAVKYKTAYEKGTLGDSAEEQAYREFVENGGVTGYTTVVGNEIWENELKKVAGEERDLLQSAMRALKPATDIGEAIEQVTRFAAYLTAREQGKDVRESVAAAKEISVNFNRKGSGKSISWDESKKLLGRNGRPLSKAERALVVAASFLPAYGRRAVMFFNASVQGLNTLYNVAKANPQRTALAATAFFAAGAINAALHAMLDGDDDDDSQYLDNPDYTRRNNLLLGGGGKYFKWALPQEMRVFYALGDMATTFSMGRYPHKNIAFEALDSALDIAPLNPAGGLTALAPSVLVPFIEIATNKDFKGSPIYKDSKYMSDEERKRTPEYRMVYRDTNGILVDLSRLLNAISGGDSTTAGKINVNPAKVQHIAEAMTGGVGTTALKLWDSTFGMIGGDGELNRNRIPFLSRIFYVADDRIRNSYINDLYRHYSAEGEHTGVVLKNGDIDSLNDKDLEIYAISKGYNKIDKKYNELLKYADSEKERRELIREQETLRKEMVKSISEIDK